MAYRPAPRRQVSTVKLLQAPVGGLNAKDSIAMMPPEDALAMDNVFPERSWAELRSGFRSYATGIVSPVETLMCWNTDAPVLLAAAGTDIYDVTLPGAVGAAIATGLTSARFQSVMFSNTGGTYLMAANVGDGLFSFDGTTWTAQAVTGPGSDAFNCISTWKRRIWLGEADTSKAWYLGTDAITGAATALDLGGVWRLGGTIVGILSTSFDSAGTGVAEYIAFMSSLGEVAVYQGSDPASSSTFALVGVFRLSQPIGNRFWTQIGGDIGLLTAEGVVSLNQSMHIDRTVAVQYAVTDKINRLFTEAYTDHGGEFGWQVQLYPRGHRMIVNIPQGGQPSIQYVMNTLSGAWCRYTGHDALCWALMGETLMFGGRNGDVFQADYGTDDDGNAIPWLIRQAPNRFGSQMQKRFTMARPLVTANGDPGMSVLMDVDYRTQDNVNVPLTIPNTSVWDTAVWDVATWGGGPEPYQIRTTIGGIGYVGSLRLAGNSRGLTMQLNATDVIFEPAGLLTT